MNDKTIAAMTLALEALHQGDAPPNSKQQTAAAALRDALAQQRKPLTQEEIIDAVRDAGFDWMYGWTLDEAQGNRFAALARIVEAAHGITEPSHA